MFDTILGMCGGSCADWDGVASGRWAGRWKEMRRRLSAGRKSVGRNLKKAHKEGRTIVFIDESGLSERPHCCRTWSPKGQTPVLQYHFNWKRLSAMARITWWSFYFRLYPGTIRSPQVVHFLTHLMRHLPGDLLIIWDGLRSQRSRMIRDFVQAQKGKLWIELLPAYAPELTPVEYLWGYWKTHELPNSCPKTFAQLSYHARRALHRMRRRPPLVTAFWKQAELF